MSWHFGLIGRSLAHTFSPQYFRDKFAALPLDAQYHALELPALDELHDLAGQYRPLVGLNVTIPYKKDVIPYLAGMDETARATGAVNCIDITPDGSWIGYNTDVLGFRDSLTRLLAGEPCPPALILGTGGAAAAVAYALRTYFRQPEYFFVSRQPAGPEVIGYPLLTERLLATHRLVVNTTPLGMYPDVGSIPPLPLDWLGPTHLVFDLVYNPPQTPLLAAAAARGARTENGQHMLEGQAEAAWRIWAANLRARGADLPEAEGSPEPVR